MISQWVEGLQNAIDYIETNLTDELDIKDIASRAYVSEFHFQRIFNALCGFTVGEYIRCRRLSLAAQELSSKDIKVIDVAMKYGYDSPDSFTRAFAKFHHMTPSMAKDKGGIYQSFSPLKIKVNLEGGTMLEYKIVEKAAFTVMGRLKKFQVDSAYDEIPKFWLEHMQSGESEKVCGMYGICIESDGKVFDYLIADNYIPWNEVPNGYITHVIPASMWAIFPCRGKLPESLQEVNTKIWKEWLPSCNEYKLGGNYNVEMYTPPSDNPNDNYSEIWIPVERV